MVFILLAKVVAFHMWPILVNIRDLSLEFVSRSSLWNMEKRLDGSIQVLLAVAISARILGKRGSLKGSGRSFRPSRCFRSRWSFGASRSLRESRFVWLWGVFVVSIRWGGTSKGFGDWVSLYKLTLSSNWSHLNLNRLTDPLGMEILEL